MTKRKLSEEEEKICTKQIEDAIIRKKILISTAKYYDLMLSELLEQQFIEKRMELQAKAAEQKREIREIEETIKILDEYLNEGVEIKENGTETENIS